MNRLRALGLSFVAVFAMTAVAATVAQAAPEYHSDKSLVFLKGESSNNVFVIVHSPANLEVTCTVTQFTGEINATPQKEFQVHPEYGGCELNGIPAKVETKVCNYKFKQPNVALEASVGVVNCSVASPIKIKSTGCTVEVSESGNGTLSTVTFDNQGSGSTRDFLMTINVGSTTATQSSGCPGGAGTFTTGTYSGTMTIKGYTSASYTTQQGTWVS